MKDNKFKFGERLEKISKMKKELPILLANQAQREFTAAFTNQNFTAGNGQQWQEVQRRIQGTTEYKYPKTKGLSRRTSPILVRTGKLRRAVSNSIRLATFEKIQLVVPLDYAKYQNDGTNNIPQRRFMGDGITLRTKQKDLINREIKKVWQE